MAISQLFWGAMASRIVGIIIVFWRSAALTEGAIAHNEQHRLFSRDGQRFHRAGINRSREFPSSQFGDEEDVPMWPTSSEVSIRPSAGTDQPDIVQFKIYGKEFYNIDLKRGTFAADIILTVQWTDPRVVEHIPQGHNSVTISQRSARRMVWLPDIAVTNREVHGVDVISTAVQLFPDGTVKKVERSLAILKNLFSVNAFPFDTQELDIYVASSSLMSDELQLVPMEGNFEEPSVEGTNFEMTGFGLVSTRTLVHEEIESGLRKSRGRLAVKVKRRSEPYLQNLLVPSMLLLGVSWSVFWFPLLGTFAMPRVATSLISFLSFITLSLRTNAMMPIRSGLTWIDMFESTCQALMFLTVVFNIFVEVVYHRFECKTLAEEVDFELKIIFPIISALVFTLCFYQRDGTGLQFTSFVITFLLAFLAVGYLLYSCFRLKKDEVSSTDGSKA